MGTFRVGSRLLKGLLTATILLSSAWLGGCASVAVGENMVAPSTAKAPRKPELANAIAVGEVTGGEDTNTLWMPKVSNAEFAAALTGSLKGSRLLAPGDKPARYRLTTTLVSFDQPLLGLDLTVTCRVRYDMYEAATGKRIFSETMITPFTATPGDSLLRFERLNLANEGAVRANLQRLVEALLNF